MEERKTLECHCKKCGCRFPYSDGYEYAIDAVICPQCRVTQFRNALECVIETPDD